MDTTRRLCCNTSFRNIFRPVFGGLFLLIFISSGSSIFAQEGTKQLIPSFSDRLFIEIFGEGSNFAAYDSEERERMNIYLRAGEKMHFGMKMSGALGNPAFTTFRIRDPLGNIVFAQEAFPTSDGQTGFIANYTEAVSGANGTFMNGNPITNGYDPFVYTATTEGNHFIEFQTWANASFLTFQRRQSWIQFIDFTVTDAANNIVTNPSDPNIPSGRLWSRQWALTTTSTTQFPVETDFFIYTEDGFVNKVRFEMRPFGFIFVSNSFGVKRTADAFENRRSSPGNALVNDVSEHQIFLNDPDNAIFPSSSIQPQAEIWFNQVKIYDYDFSRSPQVLPLNPPVVDVNKNDDDCPHESQALFRIVSNIASQIQILLDIDGNNDGFTPGGVDRALYADVFPGENFVIWDLKDGQGNPHPNGASFDAEIVFLLGGITHFPLFDVEVMEGVNQEAVRPFPNNSPTLFWDDRNIDTPPSTLTLSPGSDSIQLRTGIFTERIWAFNFNNSVQNNGNRNTMNSWFSGLELASSFQYAMQQPGICTNNDHDRDNIFDVLDIDDDNDGIPDLVECPEGVDPSRDEDNDGVLNYLDPDLPGFIDSNNDGVNDIFDRDKDQIPDFFDLDSDNDGIMDVIEAGGNDPDQNGIIEGITIIDTDLDGLDDRVDPEIFGSTPGTPLTNPDTDADGIPDNEDLDADSDGIPDNREGQTTPGYIAPLLGANRDSDFDGLNDAYDSFFNQYNTSPPFGSFGDPIAGGMVILPVNTDLEDVPDYLDQDSDNDLAKDWAEGFDDNENGNILEDFDSRTQNYDPVTLPNTDNDNNGIPDYLDNDDGDEWVNFLDPDHPLYFGDFDQDGIIDLYDEDVGGVAYGNATGSFREPDNDNDGAPNYRDISTVICLSTPVATFVGETAICTGDSLILVADEANANRFVWRRAGIEIATGRTLSIPNISATESGNDYTLEVDNGSCISISTPFSITVGAALDAGFVGNTLLCEGESLVLIANQLSGANYTWRRRNTIVGTDRILQLDNLTISDSDTFRLEVDNGICSKTSEPTFVQVGSTAQDDLMVNADDFTLCEQNSGTIIRVLNSELNTSYQLFSEGNLVGDPVLGTGGEIELNTGIIDQTNSQTFQVLATQGGCTTVALRDTVQILIDPLPLQDLNIIASASAVCPDNDGAQISVENSEIGVLYQLNDGSVDLGSPVAGDGNTIVLETGPITNLGENTYITLASRANCDRIPLNQEVNISLSVPPSTSFFIESSAPGGDICPETPVDFNPVVSQGGDNPYFEWFVNDSLVIQGSPLFTAENLQEGDRVRARFVPDLPCADTLISNEVTINLLSDLDINILDGPSEAVPGCVLTLQVEGADNFSWTPIDGIISLSPSGDVITISPDVSTTYVVTGRDAQGCIGQDSVQINVSSSEPIFIPSLFSPNNDNRNDRFIVHGECIQEIVLQVFDRAGNLLYETDDIIEATQVGWDGVHNGKDQPAGKYLWRISGSSISGEPLLYEGRDSGLVNLFR